MSASCRLQERPRPPTVDQIMSDIQASKQDDIVFSFGTPGVSRDSTPMASTENIPNLGQTMDSHSAESADVSPNEKSSELSDISTTYLKTVQLLNTSEMLKSSSENLKDQFDQLEKLGSEVSDAIAELKSVAQTVKKSS